MSQEERFGVRDLTYSAWHRSASISRFVGDAEARTMGMIDVDHVLWVEYENDRKEPLVLVEVAEDTGKEIKPSTVTRILAEWAGIAALVVLYTKATTANVADARCRDIAKFRYKEIAPTRDQFWHEATPHEYAARLLIYRKKQAELNNRRRKVSA